MEILENLNYASQCHFNSGKFASHCISQFFPGNEETCIKIFQFLLPIWHRLSIVYIKKLPKNCNMLCLCERNDSLFSIILVSEEVLLHQKTNKFEKQLKKFLFWCNGCSPCVSKSKFYNAQFVLSGNKNCPDTSFMQFASVTVYPLCCTYRCIN